MLVVAFGLPAMLVAAPWRIKNIVMVGNPFHPFFASMFRSGLDVGGALLDNHALRADNAGVELGHGWLDYLLLPVNVFVQHRAFTCGHAPTVFSPMFLLIPLGLLARTARRSAALVLFAALLFGQWAVGMQEARYYLPGALVLAAIAGGTLDALFRRYQRKPVLRGAVVATALLILLMATSRGVGDGAAERYRATLAFVGGATSREQYLAEHVPRTRQAGGP